jgi:predicted dienelactone hydrolase
MTMKNLIQYRHAILATLLLFLIPIKTILADVNYSIGHDQINIQDPARANREVTAELYYPSLSQGERVDPADGNFPLIVFSHGYQQAYTDYHVLWETLVPDGYIMLFLTTESGVNINTDVYAQDITFLLNDFLREDSQASSLVAGHLSGKSALMGHSTGGGASYLAQSLNAQSDTIISLAALGYNYGPITGSSAIDNAGAINVSSLIISGKEDCICPVESHQQPIYNNLSSNTKAMVTITQGDHCGFSDSLNCPSAEFFSCGLSGQQETMDETQQIFLSLQYITEWLDYFLKGEVEAWPRFKSLLLNDQQNQVSFQDGEEIPLAPAHQVNVTELVVNLSWSSIDNAQGYTLLYAPNPYQGAETITEVDMGTQTSVSYSLWTGASYYTAIKAYNLMGKSEISNIELFTIE